MEAWGKVSYWIFFFEKKCGHDLKILKGIKRGFLEDLLIFCKALRSESFEGKFKVPKIYSIYSKLHLQSFGQFTKIQKIGGFFGTFLRNLTIKILKFDKTIFSLKILDKFLTSNSTQ